MAQNRATDDEEEDNVPVNRYTLGNILNSLRNLNQRVDHQYASIIRQIESSNANGRVITYQTPWIVQIYGPDAFGDRIQQDEHDDDPPNRIGLSSRNNNRSTANPNGREFTCDHTGNLRRRSDLQSSLHTGANLPKEERPHQQQQQHPTQQTGRSQQQEKFRQARPSFQQEQLHQRSEKESLSNEVVTPGLASLSARNNGPLRRPRATDARHDYSRDRPSPQILADIDQLLAAHLLANSNGPTRDFMAYVHRRLRRCEAFQGVAVPHLVMPSESHAELQGRLVLGFDRPLPEQDGYWQFLTVGDVGSGSMQELAHNRLGGQVIETGDDRLHFPRWPNAAAVLSLRESQDLFLNAYADGIEFVWVPDALAASHALANRSPVQRPVIANTATIQQVQRQSRGQESTVDQSNERREQHPRSKSDAGTDAPVPKSFDVTSDRDEAETAAAGKSSTNAHVAPTEPESSSVVTRAGRAEVTKKQSGTGLYGQRWDYEDRNVNRNVGAGDIDPTAILGSDSDGKRLQRERRPTSMALEGLPIDSSGRRSTRSSVTEVPTHPGSIAVPGLHTLPKKPASKRRKRSSQSDRAVVSNQGSEQSRDASAGPPKKRRRGQIKREETIAEGCEEDGALQQSEFVEMDLPADFEQRRAIPEQAGRSEEGDVLENAEREDEGEEDRDEQSAKDKGARRSKGKGRKK